MVSKKDEREPREIHEDFQVAQAAAAGDERARRLLIGRLYDRVRNTVFYLVSNHPDVDDCVQLSIVEILLSLKNYRAQSSIESWADRITIRTTIRQVKATRRRGIPIPLESAKLPEISCDAEDRVYSHQIAEKVAIHFAKLKMKHLEALTLHLVLGYTVPEVADMTGTKLETMRDRLKVARKKLRKLVQQDPTLVAWSKRGED